VSQLLLLSHPEAWYHRQYHVQVSAEGLHWSNFLVASNHCFIVVQKEVVHHLLCRFSDLFSTCTNVLGCTDLVRHEIHTGDAKPVRQPPRRLPLAKREEDVKMSAWSSPVVLVKKKDGSTRFCVNYRRLNDLTQKDSYPLPHIDDPLDGSPQIWLAGPQGFC